MAVNRTGNAPPTHDWDHYLDDFEWSPFICGCFSLGNLYAHRILLRFSPVVSPGSPLDEKLHRKGLFNRISMGNSHCRVCLNWDNGGLFSTDRVKNQETKSMGLESFYLFICTFYARLANGSPVCLAFSEKIRVKKNRNHLDRSL